MFARFRQSPSRLDVSLIEAVRRDGKPRQQHVAGLGSVPQPADVADRLKFWQKLHARLAMLANRINAETQQRILDAIYARIPLPTAGEQHQLQLENARADAKTWTDVAGLFEANAADAKGLAGAAERTISAKAKAASAASDMAEIRQKRLERLERGEDVGGGFAAPAKIEAILTDLGFTKSMQRRAIKVSGLSAEEFEALVAEQSRRNARMWMPRNAAEHAAMIAAYRASKAEKG